ncbi:hypothetical protein ABIE62_001245 [Porphyrobacter sp. MBR-155]|jgi:hypothetical protein
MSHFLPPTNFVIASEAKQSMALSTASQSNGPWVAASSAAPRNDEGVNR